MTSDPKIPERFAVREELQRTEHNVRLRAFDSVLEQEVVLEYPGPVARQACASPNERRQMLRQARMRAKVEHDLIQPLREVLEVEDTVILVLAPRGGRSLRHVLAENGRLAPEDAVALGIQLAEAAQALHANGVVHRAIAAANILVEEPGRLSALTGFTFAKPIEGMGQTSLQFGKKDGPGPISVAVDLLHPAPEQLAGQAADARTDVFAFGCVMYECLTGQPAFADPTGEWAEPQDPARLATMPRGLAAIVAKCLRRSPVERYPTMLAVRDALAGVKFDTSGSLRPWLRWVASAAALVLVGALAVWAFQDDRQSFVPPPEPTGYLSYYSNSIAVLIGSKYEGTVLEKLNTAENDIRDIAKALIDRGWHPDQVTVISGAEATKARVEKLLGDELLRLGKDDQLFLYFAGHGNVSRALEEKNAYLLPHDAGLAPPNASERGALPVGENWLSYFRIHEFLSQCRAKHKLVALDCCHSGGVFSALRSGGQTPQGPLVRPAPIHSNRYMSAPCTYIISSCGKQQKAEDGVKSDRNSPFADGFLKALRKPGNVSMFTVWNSVVVTLSDSIYGQTPDQELLNDKGHFFFIEK